eukprot:gnl/TRDRNA2_/TRDRNA2_150762_c0_seq1.p1 gnl/TRDRNA2_/TRDRNA2_150762_c0~~gnl/TRDRNA2_/TRDRNA2_150762_c0_seq1.p1  ORF type:complete len:379 (-),score=3.53 gnl/TRDRNA2_/TRDRNA2_150762_c0_seq1:77-1144(-)
MGLDEKGLSFLLRSYDLADSIGSFQQRQTTAEELYRFYKSSGNANLALRYFEESEAMQSRMNEAESRRQVLEFEVKNELEARVNLINRLRLEQESSEKQIKSQRAMILLIILILTLLLASFILLLNRYKKINILKQNIISQNKLLKSRNTENEMLMNEIHHRVKNNLQMIGSLLSMQDRRLKTGESKEMLNLTRSRIRSIGLVHEHLYMHEKLSRIDIMPYVKNLVEIVLKNAPVKIKTALNIEDIEVDIESVVPLALILNELITNALKYGISSDSQPRIEIKIRQESENIKILVGDNGPGCAEMKTGFGWTIIKTLLEGLNGTYQVNSHGGFEVQMEIPSSQILKDKDVSKLEV